MDLIRLSKTMGRMFMRSWGASWRIRYSHPPGPRSGAPRGSTVLYSFWHGRQLPLVHTHRNEGTTVLVSMNTDGEYIANILHSMGFDTVRGSSSRGGLKAIGEMSRIMKDGIDCAITPDGPRGPACRVRRGVGLISRLSGRPVVPMGVSAWPAIRFSSWDRFMLPLPFSKVAVTEGRQVPRMKKGAEEEFRLRLESALRSVTACADLETSPAASIQYSILSGAASVAGLLAVPALLTRPETERWERRGEIRRVEDRPVWLHGSSLGELTGLMPFVREIENCGGTTFVTCSTPAGRKFISGKGLRGSFAPLDCPRFVRRFLDALGPSALVVAETELWPCTMMSALRRSIPCMMVNGRLSRSSMRRYHLMKPLLGRLFSCFTGIMTRSAEDTERFIQLGAEPDLVKTTTDAKACYDSGEPPAEWSRILRTSMPVLIAGSTREGEEEVVLAAAGSAGYMPVIAPRHLERVPKVVDRLRVSGYTPVLWSDLTTEGGGQPEESDRRSAVVVDLHGILSRLYGLGDAAFIGGTFARIGGHNILEPLQRGVPVVTGPHSWNISSIIELGSDSGAVIQVEDAEAFTCALEALRTDTPAPDRVRAVAELAGEAAPLEHFRLLLALSGALDHHGGPRR